MTEQDDDGVVYVGQAPIPSVADDIPIDQLPAIPDDSDYNADWLHHLAGSPAAAGQPPGPETRAASRGPASPGALNPDSLPPGTHQMLDLSQYDAEHWLDDGDLHLDEAGFTPQEHE